MCQVCFSDQLLNITSMKGGTYLKKTQSDSESEFEPGRGSDRSECSQSDSVGAAERCRVAAGVARCQLRVSVTVTCVKGRAAWRSPCARLRRPSPHRSLRRHGASQALAATLRAVRTSAAPRTRYSLRVTPSAHLSFARRLTCAVQPDLGFLWTWNRWNGSLPCNVVQWIQQQCGIFSNIFSTVGTTLLSISSLKKVLTEILKILKQTSRICRIPKSCKVTATSHMFTVCVIVYVSTQRVPSATLSRGTGTKLV